VATCVAKTAVLDDLVGAGEEMDGATQPIWPEGA
jgi:hypothetical protein